MALLKLFQQELPARKYFSGCLESRLHFGFNLKIIIEACRTKNDADHCIHDEMSKITNLNGTTETVPTGNSSS